MSTTRPAVKIPLPRPLAHHCPVCQFPRCRTDRAWRTIEMQCGHDVMIDQPAELAAIFERLGYFT